MKHGGNVWRGGVPGRWLDFSANLRPEGAPEWVRAAMARALEETRFYPDVAMREAKRGLAAYAGVEEACVLPASGGIAAIDAVCRAATGRVLVPTVTFGEYARRARACGHPTADAEEPARPGDTVFLCNPNNPTGEALSREAVLNRYARVKAVGARFVVDEAFVDFCPECSVRREAARESGLMVTGSLTKTLCVPGVRLGYLVADEKTVRHMEENGAPWSLNAFAVAIAGALAEHLDEIRADAQINALRRERFTRGLAQLGAKVTPSRANFLLANFGRPMRAAVVALEAEGILVRDCASFGLSDAYLRLAVKTDAENERLLKALKGILA